VCLNTIFLSGQKLCITLKCLYNKTWYLGADYMEVFSPGWNFSPANRDEISARGPYNFNIKWILRLHGKNFNPDWISARVEIFIPVYVTQDEIFSPVNQDEISHVIAIGLKKQSFKWLYFAFRLIFNTLYATTVLHKSNSRLIGVFNAQTSGKLPIVISYDFSPGWHFSPGLFTTRDKYSFD
jgi:hypothetical protein